MKQAGIAYATDQIIDLYANGITHVHVYSMNKPDIAAKISENLSRILGKGNSMTVYRKIYKLGDFNRREILRYSGVKRTRLKPRKTALRMYENVRRFFGRSLFAACRSKFPKRAWIWALQGSKAAALPKTSGIVTKR